MKHKLVRIPCGIFAMGSNEREDEQPIHTVVISKSFYMDNVPVTQKMYKDIAGKNPCKEEYGLGDDYPVYNVSWYGAVEFCNKRSEKENLEQCYIIKGKDVICNFDNSGYRLPTEAEWEYSCRAGSRTRYYWGNETDGDYCWYAINSKGKTHPVGLKKPNRRGLYDMIGNTWEWCWDLYDRKYYSLSPGVDPKGPEKGKEHVLRGGSWGNVGLLLRSAIRDRYLPDYRHNLFGFRCVSVR